MKRLRTKQTAGFTLVELMVALTISGVVIGAMYSVGSASSRHFQVQHQAANMQSSLRFAMIQVKRDLMRAGYLSTPLASLDDCGTTNFSNSIQFGGGGWIAGISSFRNNTPNLVDPTNNNAANGFVNDEITVVGNYATSNEYPGIIIDRASNSGLTLNINPTQTWHSLQQDFGWAPATGAATPVIDQALVRSVFPVGGLIRIQTKERKRHFATIDALPAVSGNTITLSFTPRIPEECMKEIDGGWVAPLQVIRYGAGSSAANTIQSDRATGSIAQLIRTQRTPRDMDTIMVGSVSRVVLDYLAAFDLSFTMTAPTGDGNPDNYLIGASANNTNDPVTVNQAPQLVRAITLTLAVRAPSTDPGMRFYNCGGLRCFQITNVAGGGGQAARVRVLRSEIFLPNIAYEGF